MNDTPTPVGFIGLGIMGGHMAGHILAAGYPLHVYNRSRANADALVARGAIWHDDPGSAAAASDVIITIVGCRGRRRGLSRRAWHHCAGASRRDSDRHDHLEPIAGQAHRRGRAGEGRGCD